MPRPPTLRLLAPLAVVFAMLTTANALNKGGDAAVFFEGGRRFLHGEPLYAGSSAADGFIGPPFQAMFFAPFAAVASTSPIAAKLLWHALNLGCLGLGVWLSMKSWETVRRQLNLPARPPVSLIGAPLCAIVLPLLTNFEHQNMNALLLALFAGATWQLTVGSAAIAGLLIGFATALKAFPAIVIVYLAARRAWTAALVATITTVALSVAVPSLVYGLSGLSDLFKTFWRLGSSGWPIRGNNQSLIAAIDRLTLGQAAVSVDAAGVRVASDALLSMALFATVALVLIGSLVVILLRAARRPISIPSEMAAVVILAILLSPIAWDHYWVMMFPAFVILYDSREERLLGRSGRYAFWTAAVLTTGLSPLTLGTTGFNVARDLSASTVAAVIAYISLIVLCGKLIAATRSQEPGSWKPEAES